MATMAIKLITGIYDDGSDRGANVQKTARAPIRMQHRSTLVLHMNVLRISGVPFDIAADSATFVLSVRQSSAEGAPGFKINGVATPTRGVNCVSFSIVPDSTKYIEPGRFGYDVLMTYGTNRDFVIPLSAFLIEPAG